MALVSAFLEIFRRPSLVDVLGELVIFIVPLWIAVVVGVLIGWAWKPKWASLVGKDTSVSKQVSSSSSLTTLSTCFASIPSLNSLKFPFSWTSEYEVLKGALQPAVDSDNWYVRSAK